MHYYIFPEHCELQATDSAIMIGNAKVHEGLYLLLADEYHLQVNNSNMTSIQSSVLQFCLLHCSDNENNAIFCGIID